jgi:adhesin/invasin
VYSATQRVTPGEPYTVTLTPVPDTITPTNTSLVVATVTDHWGNPVLDGTTITFTANGLGTILTSQPRVTVNGVATSTFQAGLAAGAASVTGTTTTAVGAASITVTPDLPYTLTLQANPPTLMANGTSTSTITTMIVDQFGNPVADNTSVSFGATLGSASTPHLTKDGRAVATFTAGTLTGTATVTATANDRSGSVQLALIPGLVDLSTSLKRANAAVFASGQTLTYTIMLTNSGNSLAANVVLTDPIPAGVTFVPGSLSGDDAAYNASQNRIEWSGTLPTGGSVKVTYAITARTTQVITVTNKAYVSLDNVLDRVLTTEAQVTPRYLYLPLVMRSSP